MKKVQSHIRLALTSILIFGQNLMYGQNEEQRMASIIDTILKYAKFPVIVIVFLLLLAGGFSYKKNDGEASKGYFIAAIVLIIVFVIAKPLAEALSKV